MYTWNDRKLKKVVHIINPNTNKTYCKLENSRVGKKLNQRSELKPEGRRVCNICLQVQKSKKISNKSSIREFYASREWHRLRYEAIKKYGPKCMCCGTDNKNGVRLHVDHIKPISKHPELALDVENLQILCALCNSGKGSWDETDWRS